MGVKYDLQQPTTTYTEPVDADENNENAANTVAYKNDASVSLKLAGIGA